MLLVFMGETYYPSGGWEDFIGAAPTIETARVMVETKADSNDDWYHIVDDGSRKIVEQGTIKDVTTYSPYEEKRQAVPE